VDKETGDKIEKGVREKLGGRSDQPGLASAVSIKQEAAE
jgi:catalase